MTEAEAWQRVQALFHEALTLPPAARQAFVEASGLEPALASQVIAMLREDERGASVLDVELAHVAHELFNDADGSLAAARSIGRYRILRRLGEGGMGVVYLAEREELGGLVAIKVLRDSWVSAERRQRFEKEQKFLASLEHPGIARLYDAGTLPDGTPYFVMEHVEGVPLVERCEQRRVSLAERLALFRSVCEAVQYAHSRALIHRDLKSSNVLVKADGSVRLLDFGVAKQLAPDEGGVEAEMTRGFSFMTPAYAAPEQLSRGVIGLYTDVYSLGVILYRLLTGSLPFDFGERTATEIVRLVTEEPPPRPSVRAREYPDAAAAASTERSTWADLDVLVLKAMHKDPRQRYPTVDALMRDLDHFAKHEPLEARPDSLGYRLRKFARRRRAPLALAGTALAVIIGLSAFFTLRLTRAKNQALAEVARTQRIQHFMERLFQGGDAETGPPEDLKVVTLVERGLREAQALDRDPPVQAELFQTLGVIYGDLGKFEQSEQLLREALAKRRALFGSESVEVAESEISLGTMLRDAARFDEAEQLARSAVAISQQVSAEHPLRGPAKELFASVLIGRGDYARAIPPLKEAVELYEQRGDQRFELSVALGDWASAEYYLGHYATAKEVNLRGLALDRRTFGAKHANVAADLINLACIEQKFGHYAESEHLEREALAITEAWFGPNHYMTASNLELLARALSSQNRNREAVELLQRALRIDEATLPANHPKISIILHDLGTAVLRLGRLDEAQADFERMLAMERRVHGEEHERVGLALTDLASVEAARHEDAKAESELRQALAIYAKRLAPDHDQIGDARVALGHALLGQRRYADALSESRSGYDILSKRGVDATGTAAQARQDLALELDALGRRDEADRFRAELAASPSAAPAPAR